MREEAVLGEANPNTREGHLTRLVDHLKNQINEALVFGHDNDAAEMQVTLNAVLESAAEDAPGLTGVRLEESLVA